MRNIDFIYLLCIIFSTSCAHAGASVSNEIKLEPLKKEDLVRGCSCNYPQEYPVLISKEMGEYPAKVRIGNRPKALAFIRTNKRTTKSQIGQAFTEFYRGEGVELDLKHTPTSICATPSSECEGERYNVDVEIRQGSKKSRIIGLNSVCGC
jgi:hypothetical protein